MITRWRPVVAVIVVALFAGIVLTPRFIHTGRVLAAVVVAPGMPGMVVDEQTERVFIGGGGPIQVLDTATGAMVRTLYLLRQPCCELVQAPIPDEPAGLVLVAVHSGASFPADVIHMLDARGGRLVRTIVVSRRTFSYEIEVTVDAPARRIVVLTSRSSGPGLWLRLYDDARGRLLRVIALPTALPAVPHPSLYALTVDQRTGRVVIAEINSGLLLALDGRNGRLLWSRQVASAPANGGIVIGAPLLDKQTDRLFVALFTMPGMVTMLDAASGRPLRTIPVRQGFNYPMVVDHRTRRVFVFSPGRVNVLDAASGRLVGGVNAGPSGLGASAVVDERTGRVYVPGGRDGSVTVLDGANGRVVRRVYVGQWPGLPVVDERTGRVIVSSIGPLHVTAGGSGAGQVITPAGNGRLSVLDGFSGAVLWSVPVGISPSAVAVDERDGHALVFNQGGSVAVADPWGWLPRWLRRHAPFLPPPAPRTMPASVSVINIR